MSGSYGRGLAALACALALLGCDPASERAPAQPVAGEEQLAELVPDLIAAVQAKQPAFVMDHVAKSFREERGLDYFDVRALVDTYAYRDDETGARLESVTIAPGEAGARRVSARVAFALGQKLAPGQPLPPGAVIYAIEVVFARDGAQWLAQSASYRRE